MLPGICYRLKEDRKNMTNLMRYMGRLELNFKGLHPNPTHYINPYGDEKPVFPPPEGLRGIMFYMMEDMRTGTARPMVVMVGDIVLDTPVAIDYEKHTGDEKRVGPRGKIFATQHARTLLDDIVKINSRLRQESFKVKDAMIGP
jgi:hypothetical protein